MYYLLDENKKPYKVESALEWSKGLGDGIRIVKQETIDDCYISTVFLGLDHSFIKKATPILFETMIFKSRYSEEYQERCATYEEALEQHQKAVDYVNFLNKK